MGLPAGGSVRAGRAPDRQGPGRRQAGARARAFAPGRAEVSGEVVDADPLARIGELLRSEPFDGVILCTLPRRHSRWLITDLPHRIARSTTVPFTQVEGDAGPSL